MGCNCGKNKQTSQWKLVRANGKTSVHGTRRSAEIADQLSGGGGTITKVT